MLSNKSVHRKQVLITAKFSSVVRFESIWILLALAAAKDYEISQFDTKMAYLHGDLKEKIFLIFSTNRMMR